MPSHWRQLDRIEAKLDALLQAQSIEFMMGVQVADSLNDVRDNLQELGVDVDTAVSEIQQQRADLEAALANAGVDQAARDEIMATIDGYQAKIQSALNPAVPIDNPDDVPHVEFH